MLKPRNDNLTARSMTIFFIMYPSTDCITMFHTVLLRIAVALYSDVGSCQLLDSDCHQGSWRKSSATKMISCVSRIRVLYFSGNGWGVNIFRSWALWWQVWIAVLWEQPQVGNVHASRCGWASRRLFTETGIDRGGLWFVPESSYQSCSYPRAEHHSTQTLSSYCYHLLTQHKCLFSSKT